MIKTKKQMFTIIGAFLLVIMLTTVTYAFFNYTRTGTANVIRTGRINFNSTQGGAINLTNMFPIDVSNGIPNDATKVGSVTINVTGDTTYTDGIEYLVTAVNVQNTVNNKLLPISIDVDYVANGNGKVIGTEDEEYFDNRGGNTSRYRVLAKDTITNNDRLVVGYIASGQTGIDGNIIIKAYLDKAKIAITDTYNGEETDNMGTTTTWVDDRVTFTTTEWNSLQQNGVSFKVKVESNEGIWVEEILSVNAMVAYFPSTIGDLRTSIKEVYFNKMGRTRMQNAYDAATIKADLTNNNEGKVLAWLEENPDDNTKYNLIVASDGETYLSSCGGLFYNFSNLEKVEFNNIDSTRVTMTNAMFQGCSKLEHIDWGNINLINVSTMSGMFQNCSSLESIDLSNLNITNVTQMNGMFSGCSSLTNVNLSGIGSNNLTHVGSIFNGCTNLREINMSNFNFGSSSMGGIFSGVGGEGLTSLEIVDLSNANVSNVTNMSGLFNGSSNLERIYVSSSWSVENVTLFGGMFNGCTSLVGQAPNTSYSFDSNDAIDKTYAKIATDNTKGYLTDISLKPTN